MSNCGKLTYNLNKKLGVSRRTVYRWHQEGIDVVALAASFNRADYITVSEAAKIIGVSDCTIYRWIAEDNIVSLRIGKKKTLVHKDFVSEILKKFNNGM